LVEGQCSVSPASDRSEVAIVTTPFPEEEPPTRTQALREQAEAAARIIVAGSSVGAMRRIVLYVIVGIALAAGGTVGVLAGLVGIIAILLLAMTDQNV
jgi:hypothetical protein